MSPRKFFVVLACFVVAMAILPRAVLAATDIYELDNSAATARPPRGGLKTVIPRWLVSPIGESRSQHP